VEADPALLTPFRDAPSHAAVLVDYDGTLAPIVDDPASARPLPGAGEVLLALRSRFAEVAVVSGRPVAFLADQVPREVTLCGLYGLEERRDGVVSELPSAAGWRARVDEVVRAARAELPPGVEVEHKGLSLTLHVRRHPELADRARAWAAATAEHSGLEARLAKMSVELHPAVGVDKGTIVDRLADGLAAACYLGDDDGDLPAFHALDRVAGRGGTALRVAVVSTESSAALVALADLTVDGPEGALALLRELAG
jgi:trehalose 6-phosphate phosphatase